MKSNFAQIWDNEVKELAAACINRDVVEMLHKPKGYVLTEEEKAKMEEWNKQYVDLLAMYYISDMCFRVEHGLADGREWQVGLAVAQIYATLNSESYWKNVFNNNQESDEAKKLIKLRDGLRKLI